MADSESIDDDRAVALGAVEIESPTDDCEAQVEVVPPELEKIDQEAD